MHIRKKSIAWSKEFRQFDLTDKRVSNPINIDASSCVIIKMTIIDL